MWTKLVTERLFPLWETSIRKRPTLSYLSSLEESQWWSLGELHSHQENQLCKLLTHAKTHSPFYEGRLANIDVENITLQNYHNQVPILTRADAQQAGKDWSCKSPASPIRKTTGGTTGEPLVIRYNLDSEYRRQANKLRGFGWSGYQVGKPTLHYWGRPSRPGSLQNRLKQKIDRGIKQETYVDCTKQDADAIAQVIQWLQNHPPMYLLGYAQATASLARKILEQKARTWNDITVISGAEPVFPDDRAVLEQAFGPVFETYGCREFMLIGMECDAHDGFHLSMENLIVEIIVHDDTGSRPARPGETGEVVITDLYNLGTPFIRYANGDRATLGSEQLCSCGRAHPRIARVDGRTTDTLRNANGEPVGGMLFNLIFSPMAEHLRQFQVHQKSDGAINILIIPAPSFNDEVLQHLQAKTKEYLGGLPTTVELVKDIPVSKSGKRTLVVVDS